MGRLKHSEYKAGMRQNPDLDLFGYWQTKEFEPPIAENGRIPRNEFGNVELFQPQMLPIGCVHLKNMPNLNRICRKLSIDCVAAVIGFDAHGGFSHAVYDGWIICEEFKETVSLAYEQFEQEEAKNQIKKRHDRIIANWTRLAKLLLIRKRLNIKYGEAKTSVFNKVDSKAKSFGKCLNEEPKKVVNPECAERVGGKLNNVTSQPEVLDKAAMPQTSNTKETAFLKNKGNKLTKTKKKTETKKVESSCAESSDPEIDFKDIIKQKKLKNPPRNAKKKPAIVIESDPDSNSNNKESDDTKKSSIPKLDDKHDDVKLSESEED
jgi:hypothetical protein